MVAKRILACTDLSVNSKRAVQHAGEQARTNGSKVTLIHVADPQSFVPPQAVLEAQTIVPNEETLKAQLGELRDELLSGLDVEITFVSDHSPARAICDYAADCIPSAELGYKRALS